MQLNSFLRLCRVVQACTTVFRSSTCFIVQYSGAVSEASLQQTTVAFHRYGTWDPTHRVTAVLSHFERYPVIVQSADPPSLSSWNTQTLPTGSSTRPPLSGNHLYSIAYNNFPYPIIFIFEVRRQQVICRNVHYIRANV